MSRSTAFARWTALASIVSLVSCDAEPTALGELPDTLPLTVALDTHTPITFIGAGDIADCSQVQDGATAALVQAELAADPNAVVFTLGDNVNETGTTAEFNDCYEPTWGPFRTATNPSLGNKDYLVPGAQGAFDYFGAAALGNGLGYYSYDLGAWHVIVLNDQIDRSVDSPQLAWLRGDLAASSAQCTVAMFHEPRFWSFSGSSGVDGSSEAIWRELYLAGVDLVLGGHRHQYERFAPQDFNGTPDPQHGVRQIIAGTGGADLANPTTIQANSEVLNSDTHGILKLILDAGSYSWEFIPVAGETFTDSGSETCHGPPPAPPETIALTATVRPDDRVRLDWSGAVGSRVDIWRNGVNVASTRNDGATTRNPGPGTFTYQICEQDFSACSNEETVSVGVPPPNQPPSADAGGPYQGLTGATIQFDGTGSSDPEGGPLTYSWDFGDGATGTGPQPTHTYAAEADYDVSLIVTDDQGLPSGVSTTTASITDEPPPNQAPTADAGGPYAGAPNVPVQFDGTGSSDPEGGPLTYAWDFGDGATGTGPTPSHTYTSEGVFPVSLVVTDDQGAPSDPASQTQADITEPPPSNITLDTRILGGSARVRLDWTGAEGSRVDVERDGVITRSTTNDGATTDTPPTPSGAYTYRICEQATAECSNPSTVVFGGSPPIADAGGPYTGDVGIVVNFDGTASSDPGGSIVDWSWDFGDGNTGTGPTPSHTYAAPGNFTVTLIVTDNDTQTDTDVTQANIQGPNQAPTADPGGPYVGQEGVAVQFDGTGSSDPEGGALTYAWDFGDGSQGTGPTPQHTYATASLYTVTLTVTDVEGEPSAPVQTTADIAEPQPNQPPTADPGGPYTGDTGVDVQFDGTGSSDPEGGPLTYAWDFGDGSNGTGATPTHAYAAPGQYTVRLVVTDNQGAPSTETTTTADISDPPPNQSPTADPGGPYTGDTGASVQFDGTGSSDPEGGPLTYAWDFGDGTNGTGATPTHAYGAPGQYTVRLIVTDDQGAPSTEMTTTADISDPPQSNITLTTRLLADGRVRMDWSGANGDRVDIERNGVITRSTTNDGATTDTTPGPGEYSYRICEQATGLCSNVSTITVP